MFGRAFLAILCLVLGATGMPQANAGSERNSALHEELQGKLDQAYGPIWGSGDAAKFVDEFLTDDVVITASDSPKVWMGDAQSTALIAELMVAFPRIKATSVWTAPVGPDAAYQYVVFELIPAEEGAEIVAAKSLYVWVKTVQGWRVTADHYSFSGMDSPQ